MKEKGLMAIVKIRDGLELHRFPEGAEWCLVDSRREGEGVGRETRWIEGGNQELLEAVYQHGLKEKGK